MYSRKLRHKYPTQNQSCTLAPAKGGLSLKFPEAGLGFEGFFLGYPFNLQSSDLSKIHLGFPLALVKRCSLSGVEVKQGIPIYILDGQNNPGFSGGPVFLPMSTRFNDHSVGLLGIISGYYAQVDTVHFKNDIISYKENSGIMYAFGSQVISRIIEQNKDLKR